MGKFMMLWMNEIWGRLRKLQTDLFRPLLH
ncbi:hypothetical protein HmCmsJML268_02828 [Escherichia coli]|nr:hypothetical protein BvCmsA113A_02546 [Escherichia coli]GDE77764.1 hypothetical protein HmCmsJML268_02828 [Escherichia coli]